MTPFQQKVYAAVKKIPRGSVTSYAQLATAIGHPKAYRAVARALSRNTSRDVPCHRVIRSDGTVGGYNGLRGSKAVLLAREASL